MIFKQESYPFNVDFKMIFKQESYPFNVDFRLTMISERQRNTVADKLALSFKIVFPVISTKMNKYFQNTLRTWRRH